MSDNQAACAHSRVKYVRVEENGICHDTWRCESECGVYFWPTLSAFGPGTQQEIEHLSGQVDALLAKQLITWEMVRKADKSTGSLHMIDQKAWAKVMAEQLNTVLSLRAKNDDLTVAVLEVAQVDELNDKSGMVYLPSEEEWGEIVGIARKLASTTKAK